MSRKDSQIGFQPGSESPDFAPSRRDLFHILGAGLLVLIAGGTGAPLLAQESGGSRRRQGGQAPTDVNAWLHIGEDGIVTVFTGKVEVGQNTRTSLTQAAAEELCLPVERVRLTMADTDLTPYDAGTFGSRSTPTMSPQIRRAAIAAREFLLDEAAAEWSVERAALTLGEGAVHEPGGKTLSYPALLKGKKLTKTIDAHAPLTPPERQTVLGKPVLKVDGRSFVTGGHHYTSDIRRDGMLYGRVLRPEILGAKLASVDLTAAKALPGITVVRDGDFIGVVAPTTAKAANALDAIKATWTSPLPAQLADEKNLFVSLRGGPVKSGVNANTGVSTYTVAYIAHTPLEPRAAVAEWNNDRLTVWTGTQRPFGVKSDLASALSIPEDRVRVIVPDTGSAYGGKHTGEAAIEAARLAKGAGKPVKRVWTREEEFAWAYFRPAGVIEVDAALTPDNTLARWSFHNYNSGGSGLNSPYEIPERKEEYHRADSPLRQGSYRGLAATANHFARESHMDDLARQAKLDPLEFRRKNLKDARLRAVLEAAASEFGWERRHPESVPGRGFGLAAGTEKGSYVSHCAEVEVRNNNIRVVRIVVAFECGTIVNPLHLENQVEGSTVMGLGGALFEAIHFENGQITNRWMSQYRVPRFKDVPPIKVVLLNRKDLPSVGAGETPIVTIAPAIRNAILDATGVRLFTLPLKLA